MKNLSVAIRLTPELRKSLEKAAEKLDLSMHDVAKHAIRCAVEEIERNNYQIEWPPQFRLAKSTEKEKIPLSPQKQAIVIARLREMFDPSHEPTPVDPKKSAGLSADTADNWIDEKDKKSKLPPA